MDIMEKSKSNYIKHRFKRTKGHLSQSQSKLESSVKFCWSRGLGPWQHSCRMCYRMEFIKIPLHTEHMYSPEEVEEEDLWYASELRRCTAYNMKAKNRLRICTFTHTRKLKVGMYVCTM